MRDFISRLIDCGMPRAVAVCVCRHYSRIGSDALARYVAEVEVECRECMERV